MKLVKVSAVSVAALFLLDACASPPMGPTISVMPGPNKPFDVFQQDSAVCKDFASQQVAGQAERANNQAIGTAAIGTVLGAGLGAAIGGGQGAAIGAGSGALIGTAAGSGPTGHAQYSIQQQYDNAYAQCMYSHGDQVPGYAAPPPAPSAGYPPPPPPSSSYPPPPPPAPGY
jgi:uncharacterized protein YcfJ